MATRLQRLVRSIEPLPDRVDHFADSAMNSFRMPSPIVSDWDACRRLLKRFHAHVRAALLQCPDCADITEVGGECEQLLQRRFGPSWPQAVFEVARTGAEGGLYRVLRELARMQAAAYSEQLVAITVDWYCRHRSAEQVEQDVDEYITSYGRNMPPELIEGTAARIRHPQGFANLLKRHPFVMHRLRQATRSAERTAFERRQGK